MREIPEEGLRIWMCSRIGYLSFLDVPPKDWCLMDNNRHCSKDARLCDAKPYKIVPVKEER